MSTHNVYVRKDLTLRRARAADVARIRDVVTLAYAKYIERIGRKPPAMSADLARAIDEHQVWVVDHGDALVGVLELVPHEGDLLIENVAVRPSHHAQGIGRMFVQLAESEAAKQKSAAVRLAFDERCVEALTLCKSLGYLEAHRDPRQQTLVRLAKSITKRA
ncbi:MAG TPA: GNAT family N-acetyltransferase [Alphaproteobacteria bacterium]